jgi:hypothetical protein
MNTAAEVTPPSQQASLAVKPYKIEYTASTAPEPIYSNTRRVFLKYHKMLLKNVSETTSKIIKKLQEVAQHRQCLTRRSPLHL